MELNVRATEFNGSCLCGAVRFSGRDLRDVVYCHCKQCRSAHGSTAAYSATPTDMLKFTQQDDLRWYNSSPFVRRGFCANCGSSLFWQRLDSTTICIAVGAIDDVEQLRAARHIYVADKAAFEDISDRLPRFEGSMYG